MLKNLLAIISSIAFLNAFSQPGSLDSSFGVNGLVTLPSDVHLNKIVVQIDGKIVGAGYVTNGTGSTASCIVRYKTDGTLDNSFNGTGMLTDAFMNEALGLAVQPDGKIVIVGYVTTDSSYTDPNNPDNNVIDVDQILP